VRVGAAIGRVFGAFVCVGEIDIAAFACVDRLAFLGSMPSHHPGLGLRQKANCLSVQYKLFLHISLLYLIVACVAMLVYYYYVFFL
jgi:hypothetical protein